MCSGRDISCLMRQLFSSITVLLRAGLGHALDSWRNRASTPGRGKRSRLSRNVRTSCGSHPSSCSKRYSRVIFLGLGRPCRERHQSPTLVSRSRMSGAMSSLVCAWLAERELYIQFTFYFVIFVSYEHVLAYSMAL